eukprot:CAMPEP_0197175210 /NCGR_PEP_ID=MMETSP1423-20130617/1486_1 /TAXON_ID=476441 /ORGANISM="Pseudo-nitzschia heimii, Strain UNC1101" /LENGTH=517 /DNA_ID=CAMNT_0042624311 /DNA_START=65 /DNA_END=1618 /DNA_ORIENTATION=-
MSLIELNSADQVKTFLDTNVVGVVTFSAHWCGPCKASKPQLEALAKKSPIVPVSIVHESDIGDYLHTFNVRAFPTYVLFHKGTEVQRVEGANLQGVQSMIEAHADKAGPSMPSTGGNTLGGSLGPSEARALRLAKLGGGSVEGTSSANNAESKTGADSSAPMETEDSKPATTESEASEGGNGATTDDVTTDDLTTDDENAAGTPETAKINPADDLDPVAIKTLTEDMGFALIRAQKGLLYSERNTVESAVEWLMEHQDDADIDDPIPEGVVKKTLTEGEKAAKILEVKALMKARRAERDETEKVDHTEREKQRRFMGKEADQTRELMAKEQRKREAQARKREKMEQKKERDRIRAELEKDKRERMANKGKLKGRLGVDGYAPSAIQYENGEGGEPAAQRPKTGAGASAAKIDEYIGKVASYRAGGDGGKCLKVLTLLVGNAADNPTEDKFKRINMETKTFKNKIKPFLGAKTLLMAVGFGLPEKNNDGSHLVLKEDADVELLKSAKVKLEQALAKYG